MRRTLIPVLALACLLNILSPKAESGEKNGSISPLPPVTLEESSILTVEDAVSIALTHNPRLHQAQGNTRSAHADYRIARSELFPKAHAIALGAFGPPGAPAINGLNGLVTGSRTFGTAVNVVWTPFDFGQTWAEVKSAKAQFYAQEDWLEATRLAIALRVKEAYYTVQYQEALVSLYKDILKNRAMISRQAKEFADKGLRSMVDFEMARTLEAQVRQQWIEALNERNVSYARLQEAMGTQLTHEPSLQPFDAISPEMPAESAEHYRLEALAMRPEMKAVNQELLAARQKLKAAQRGFLPTTRFVGGAGYIHDDDELENTDNDNRYGAFGGFVEQPLYTGGELKGYVEKASAGQSIQNARQQEVALRVATEVVESYTRVKAAIEKISLAEQTLRSATEAHRLAQRRYQLELGDMAQLSQADIQLIEARRLMTQARYEYLLSQARFEFALGKL